MKIIIDTREQAPFAFEGKECEVVTGTLTTGDYSLVGLEDKVALERKSLSDLVGCLSSSGRERFERELTRARGLYFFGVVIEAGFTELTGELTGKQYRSAMNPHAAAQSILAFQVRYGTPFIWAGSRRAAEYITFSFLSKYLREAQKRLEAIVKAHGGEYDVRSI